MFTLLITAKVAAATAGFVFVFCIAVIAYAVRTAECYEHEDDPVYTPGDYTEIEARELTIEDFYN